MLKWKTGRVTEKPVHNHTNALGAFERGFVFAVFVFFPPYKVECPWSRQAHVFLMRLSLRRYPCDPHLPQMLLRCHDEAYPPIPLPTFHLRKHLAKVAAWKRSVESTCQKAEPHFTTPINSFFFSLLPLRKLLRTHPLFVSVLGSVLLFRTSGGTDCARIFCM